MSSQQMGKIEALNEVDDELLRTIDKIERNTLSVNKTDLYYLAERFNQCNTAQFTRRELDVCGDCRSNLLNFWRNVVLTWKKTKPSK
jgi:hypothetical protein